MYQILHFFKIKFFFPHSVSALQVVCICILISTCLADVGYYGPIYKDPFYKGIYKGPFYKGIYKGPFYKGFYKGPFSKGIYKAPLYYADDEYPGYEYGGEWPIVEDGDKWSDYWEVFKESFLRSYEELKKPYIVEKHIPIPGRLLLYIIIEQSKRKSDRQFKYKLSNVNNE